MPSLIRTHIGVARRNPLTGEVQRFTNITAALRALAGSPTELLAAETRRIRARLRSGATDVADSLGFVWNSVGSVQPLSSSTVSVSWDALTFGVELEVVAGPSVSAIGDRVAQVLAAVEPLNLRGWKVVRDGSVSNGAEVVSPILRGEDGLAQLTKVCDALKAAGFTANRTCGMHVHVGAREFSVPQIANVCRSMLANEQHFDAVVAVSRRGNNNHYCQSHGNMSVPAAVRTISGLAQSFNGGWDAHRHYTPYRYRKLNLQSYALHGTVEFRQHQGTVESSRAVAWVRLVTGFAAAALSGNTDRLDFEQFAALAGPAANFITARREHFAQRRAA